MDGFGLRLGAFYNERMIQMDEQNIRYDGEYDTNSDVILFQRRTRQKRQCAICGGEIPWFQRSYTVWELGNNVKFLDPICPQCWMAFALAIDEFRSWEKISKARLLNNLQEVMENLDQSDDPSHERKSTIEKLIQELVKSLKEDESFI